LLVVVRASGLLPKLGPFSAAIGLRKKTVLARNERVPA
jgi:hypothetical protein